MMSLCTNTTLYLCLTRHALFPTVESVEQTPTQIPGPWSALGGNDNPRGPSPFRDVYDEEIGSGCQIHQIEIECGLPCW